jgi:hypothetical protein
MALTVLKELEAAAMLRAAPQTLRQWRARKTGPPYIKAPSGSISYLREDLEAYLGQFRVVPGEPKPESKPKSKRQKRGAV